MRPFGRLTARSKVEGPEMLRRSVAGLREAGKCPPSWTAVTAEDERARGCRRFVAAHDVSRRHDAPACGFFETRLNALYALRLRPKGLVSQACGVAFSQHGEFPPPARDRRRGPQTSARQGLEKTGEIPAGSGTPFATLPVVRGRENWRPGGLKNQTGVDRPV